MATKIQLTKPKPMITLGFYTEYQKRIMDEYKYENAIRPLTSFYEVKKNNSFLRFEEFSFEPKKNPQVTGKSYTMEGLLVHYATPDAYNEMNNLDSVIKAISDKKEGCQFLLFMYGDLKTFCFKSRFMLLHNEKTVDYKITKFKFEIAEELHKDIEEIVNERKDIINENFYLPLKDNKSLLIHDIDSNHNSFPIYIKNAIFTNNNSQISNIILVKNNLLPGSINFKEHTVMCLENIVIHSMDDLFAYIKENAKNMESNTIDLKGSFNPETVAENAVDLNINLMKWRMCPYLNTDIIRNQKYLLVGAGTLGCHVSRCLLGWGARHITFLDNGKVSYSNPVRQSLYTFEDSCKTENNYKAILAAEMLKKVFPMADSKGYRLSIPLPGRTLVNEESKKEYFTNLELLEREIKACDVMFLLTDSRESRWYPTVIAKAYDKEVITAAIGFDTYLVMRHGNSKNNLGCYFCSDISTPGDTSGNRTLDQQCTISRPGTSMICSGMATELGISLFNHALNDGDKDEHIPHQMRGNILKYEINHFRFQRNKNCVACSDTIVNEYKNNRENFALSVMNDPSYIEKQSGVYDLIKDIKIDDFNVDDDF